MPKVSYPDRLSKCADEHCLTDTAFLLTDEHNPWHLYFPFLQKPRPQDRVAAPDSESQLADFP